MTGRVYKKIELTGSSTQSIENAVEVAINKASSSIKNMRWFEVIETRGDIKDNKVHCWQVTIKVGFKIDD